MPHSDSNPQCTKAMVLCHLPTYFPGHLPGNFLSRIHGDQWGRLALVRVGGTVSILAVAASCNVNKGGDFNFGVVFSTDLINMGNRRRFLTCYSVSRTLGLAIGVLTVANRLNQKSEKEIEKGRFSTPFLNTCVV